jgi:V8-like Glu-specific endopeptidase
MPEAPPYALDRMADEADYAVVGPVDGRSRVADTRAFPYSAICHIERDFGDGRLTGCSAFLIGPTTLLTAGHCIASPLRLRLGLPGQAKRIRIWPGRGGKTATPFGFQWAKSWRVHPAYLRSPRPEHDIGVIELARPIHPSPGHFALRLPDDAELQRLRATRLLHISGYPGDKPLGTQWEHAERLDRVTPAPGTADRRSGCAPTRKALPSSSPSTPRGRSPMRKGRGAAAPACRWPRPDSSIAEDG